MSAKTACLGQSFSLILGPCPTPHVLKHWLSWFSREDREDKALSCPARQGRVDCRTPRPPPSVLQLLALRNTSLPMACANEYTFCIWTTIKEFDPRQKLYLLSQFKSLSQIPLEWRQSPWWMMTRLRPCHLFGDGVWVIQVSERQKQS